MVQGYNDVLDRLKEVRERHMYSQEAISRILDMTQSHYSKAERGDTYFTYEQMQRMNDAGLDVHYIISGKPISVLENQTVLAEVRASDYYFFGQFFFVLVEQLLNHNKNASYQEIFDQSAVMRYILTNGEKNIWKLIRYHYDYSQVVIAQELGLNLRKYGRLENGERLPDSEILFLVYARFRIPPQLLLEDNRGIMNAIGEVMEVLHEIDRTKIIKLWKTEKEIFDMPNSAYGA